MGRPEKPVDPTAGPIQRLAHELRELRERAGRPTYRRMAGQAHVSTAALAQAASGTRLPSLDVLRAYVRACGGDPAEWETRWREAEAEAAGAVRADERDVAPPYRGLARFEPDDREVFFGRDRLVEQLCELVRDHRFAVVFGASGSGKSSLLRAGLVPRLREKVSGESPAVLRVLTPGPRPAETYGHLLTPATDEPEAWVMVDQFEEVFTLCRDKAERARFIDLLLAARAPASRLRVLIAVRADFYVRCGEHRELAEALHGAGLLVGPMSAVELRDVVTRPAQAAGLMVERDLTARIVAEVLDEPGGLPMLSHALLETWRRRRGRMLTLATYEAVGGMRGSIAASAEETYERLSDTQARAARHLLLRMIEPGLGAPDTRRPLPRAELAECSDPDVRVAEEAMTRARLLTVDDDGVHLAHEALITCWPRLQGWIEEDRERLRHHRALTEAARVWLEHDRDPGTLYRGSRLARAQEVFPAPLDDPALTTTERAFLSAAFEAREAEARAAARSRHRNRTLLTTLSAVLAVALVAGLAAWQQHADNRRRTTDDAARRIAEVADALRTTDPRTAGLLGVAAWRVSRLPETRRALLGALTQPETDTFADPTPGNSLARYLTDSGRTLLSIDGRTWRTWDVAAHRRIASGRLPDGQVSAVAPDGRILAVLGADGHTRLWDTATDRWTRGPAPTPGTVILFADGGLYSENGLDSDLVRLRSVSDGQARFQATVSSTTDVAASQGGRLMAFCPAGQGPRVYEVSDRRVVRGGWEKEDEVCADDHATLLFGAAGRFAVVSSRDVQIWDTGTGHGIARLDVPNVSTAAFSADGTLLATTDALEIKIWRLSAPAAPVFRHPLDDQHLSAAPAWDPTRPLLRYVEGGTVHTLDVTPAVTAPWVDPPPAATALSPDGRTLAVMERQGGSYRVRLRDTDPTQGERTLPSPPSLVPSGTPPAAPSSSIAPLLAFSADSTALVYGASDSSGYGLPQQLTVWDTARGRRISTLDLPGAVVDLALGNGGRTLYTIRASGVGNFSNEVWDIASHRRTAVYPTDSAHLALRPDGRLLVTDDAAVHLPSGALTTPDLVRGAGVGALAFAPDGSRFAAGDLTGRVTLWDKDVRHSAGVLRSVFPGPLGDTAEAVGALALSPDGSTLAVGGDSGSLQLWDIATQQPLGSVLSTPDEAITSLSFSTDSATLYAAGAHVPLQRYTVGPAQAVELVCTRVGGTNLTRAQWRTYAPDVPYRRVCSG
ncbi:helix-turn-helix domain-containing protein [Streptomyces sp. NPDC004539]|uniref:nSTAND1 domain-containing NTPase n=1 Tax=Streptomyces sp. NPDC004539 TaxID=3154280 RepID=UPI0033AB8A5F